MKKYQVEIHTDVYEDNYSEGEGQSVSCFTNDYTVNSESPMSAVGEALSKLGYSFNASLSAINDENDNQVWYSNLVDVDNIEVNEGENQYDDFKEGKINLYSANHSIFVYELVPVKFTDEKEPINVVDEKFARKCSITGKGINQGFVVGDGDMYFGEEADLLEHLKTLEWENLDGVKSSDIAESELMDYFSNEEYFYWTEWEEIDEDDYYDADGNNYIDGEIQDDKFDVELSEIKRIELDS
jgi:hypothetical protein